MLSRFRTLTRVALLLALSLALGTAANAAFASSVARSPTASDVDDAYYPKYAAATPAKYPNADYAILRRDVTTDYKADGTAFTNETVSYRIFTEKGRRELRTQSFSYNIFYEDFKIVTVAVRTPKSGNSFSKETIDIAANSKEMTDRSSMGANIYDPNDKVRTLTIPNLKIGDDLLVVTERKIKRPYMEKTFSDWQTLESTAPILSFQYLIAAPDDAPLRSTALLGKIPGATRNTGAVEYSTEKAGAYTAHTWTARNIPQAFPEPAMPGLDSCGQRLRVSTIGSWQDISKWYWRISEPHLKSTPAIEAKVRELTAGAATDAEKITRVFRFVSQEIRYMGITLEKDAPGFEPHDVNITFDNRYGVCRDKAALLVTMLRAAGFDAYPVLIMVGPLLDKEVPTPYFNHAITAVRHKDGSYQLMDTTNEHTADLFPAYLFNKSYLVASPDGADLQTSPVAPPADNMLDANTRLALLPSGDLSGTTELRFGGINDTAWRGHLVRQKPEDTRRLFESILKEALPGARLGKLRITPDNLQKMEPLSISLEFTKTAYLENRPTALPLPDIGEQLAIATRVLARGTGLEKRRFPLEVGQTCGVREQVSLVSATPDATDSTLAQLHLPEDKTIETPALRYSRKTTKSGTPATAINTTTEILIRAPQVQPADYAAHKLALKNIEQANRQQPLHIPAATAAAAAKRVHDVDILHRNRTVDLYIFSKETGYEWTSRLTEKKRVNTYAGKTSNAEIKMDYNPVWETARLVSAQVTQADGTVRPIKPEEINIMDAPWAASAPRYPVGKTLVAALPGVEVGATIEYTIERTAKKRPTFFIENSLFSFDKVHDDNFTLNSTWCLWRETQNYGSGEAPYQVAMVNKDSTGKPAAMEQFSYKGISYGGTEKENALPPLHTFAPTFRLASHRFHAGTLPRDFVDKIRKETSDLIAPSDTILDKAAAITKETSTWLRPQSAANAATPEERRLRTRDAQLAKIRAIRDFVAKNIRLDGPNFTELPLDYLSPPEKTLADGYGNEADRAILLASLLKAAGYRPYLVLATNGPTLDVKPEDGSPRHLFPSQIFNRLIVCLPFSWTTEGTKSNSLKVQETIYFDQLSQYADFYGTALEGSLAIPLDGKGARMITIKAGKTSGTVDAYSLTIAENGDAEFSLQHIAFGAQVEGLRRHLHEMTPEERSRFQQQLTTSISQGATGGEFDFDYSHSVNYALRKVNVARFAVRSGDYLYFDLPGAIREVAAARTDKRLLPFALAGNVPVQRNIWTITLPAGAEIISAPQPIRWEFYNGHGVTLKKQAGGDAIHADYDGVTISCKPGKDALTGAPTLEVKQDFRRTTPAVVPADNYPALLEINRRLSAPTQWQVLIKLKK